MSNSSVPHFKISQQNQDFLGLDKISFPVYALTNPAPRCSLYGRYGATIVTLNYLCEPVEPVYPPIVGITSTIESADVWPPMLIQANQTIADLMMDHVRMAFPSSFPSPSVMDYDVEVESGMVAFYQLIQDGTLNVETDDYQSKSGLHFRIQYLEKPFPFARAYARHDSDHVHVIVMTAGYSRAERLAILDLLVPLQGTNDLVRHMEEYWPKDK